MRLTRFRVLWATNFYGPQAQQDSHAHVSMHSALTAALFHAQEMSWMLTVTQ